MKHEQVWAARVVLVWARIYTAALPVPVRVERLEELCSDVHDQITEDSRAGVPSWRTSRAVLERLVRGLPADLTWRAEMEAAITGRPVALARPGAVLVALALVALPFLWAAETAGRRGAHWSQIAQGPAWLIACVLWAVSISYALVALVYGLFHRRSRQ